MGLHLRPPLAPATGSRPAGSGAAGWPAPAGPLATTPPWAPALRRPGTAGPRNPRISLSRPGASPGTPGHLREAQDSFQEHFSCVCTQAECTDTEGSVLDHRDKARITINKSRELFGFLVRTESMFRESPGSSVVQTPHFHCRVHGFDSWSENLRSRMPCGADKKKMRREKKSTFILYAVVY